MAASSTALSSISPAPSSVSLMIPSIAGAGRALELLAELFEHLVQALDLLVSFVQMRLEARYQIAIGRFLDHLRKRLGDLLLRVIDVLQLMQQQVIHCFDVFGENAHVSLLCDGH